MLPDSDVWADRASSLVPRRCSASQPWIALDRASSRFALPEMRPWISWNCDAFGVSETGKLPRSHAPPAHSGPFWRAGQPSAVDAPALRFLVEPCASSNTHCRAWNGETSPAVHRLGCSCFALPIVRPLRCPYLQCGAGRVGCWTAPLSHGAVLLWRPVMVLSPCDLHRRAQV